MSREPRIATGRHPQALRQLRPGFASLREGDLGERLGLSQGAPGVHTRERREALRKGGARTPWGAAGKAAHPRHTRTGRFWQGRSASWRV